MVRILQTTKRNNPPMKEEVDDASSEGYVSDIPMIPKPKLNYGLKPVSNGKSSKISTRRVAVPTLAQKALAASAPKDRGKAEAVKAEVVSVKRNLSDDEDDKNAAAPTTEIARSKHHKSGKGQGRGWRWLVRPGERDPRGYEVEAIMERAVHTTGSSPQKLEDAYRVKWVGYGEETWEPVANMEKDIPDIVRAFEKGQKADNSASAAASLSSDTFAVSSCPASRITKVGQQRSGFYKSSMRSTKIKKGHASSMKAKSQIGIGKGKK